MTVSNKEKSSTWSCDCSTIYEASPSKLIGALAWLYFGKFLEKPTRWKQSMCLWPLFIWSTPHSRVKNSANGTVFLDSNHRNHALLRPPLCLPVVADFHSVFFWAVGCSKVTIKSNGRGDTEVTWLMAPPHWHSFHSAEINRTFLYTEMGYLPKAEELTSWLCQS